jgi:hypothetical protein
MDNVKGILDEIQQEFYTTPALIPPMTWQDSIAPSAPTLPTYEKQVNDSIKLSWVASKDNHDLSVVYHLYASNTYPVNTNDAQNLMLTSIKGNTITLQNKKKYFAITSADRYGNESTPVAFNHPNKTEIPILNQGNKLILPESENIQEVLICNSIGETILRTKVQNEISLELLPKGFYIVYTFNKEKKKTFAGTILK